ncbi:MAG: hypothetical protein K2X38_00020 [Gemmataceae bacterium]|nr:hypothetical protein [Gemmataceae bacterium]
MKRRILVVAVLPVFFVWGPLMGQSPSVEEQLRRNGAVSLPRVALIDVFLGRWERAPKVREEGLQVNINDAKAFGRDGIKSLQSAANLRQVCVGEDFPEEWCADLSKLTQLEGLYFTLTPFTASPEKSGLGDVGKMHQLRALSLLNAKVGDEHIRRLSSLKGLRFLCLAGNEISDEGLKSLTSMLDLEEIDLDRTKVCGDGFVHLRGTPKLRRIRITNEIGGLTEAGLKHLAKMPDLREIVGRGNIQSEAHIKLLAFAPKLQTLDLGDAAVSDESIKFLLDYPNLKHLDLTATGVSGKALKTLSAAKNLEELNLALTAVDDPSLEFVQDMPRLRTINLASTKVTKTGTDKLRKHRPDLEILGSFE